MSECTIEGCGKPVLAKGWCSMHYNRWRKNGDPLTIRQEQHHGLSLMERLLARRQINGSCWEWTGSADVRGYGRLNIGNAPVLVHRASWEAHHGPIPAGKYVCHRCDNPKCFRPEHLFLGDQQMNMDDKMKKKRHRYGVSRGTSHGGAKLTDQQVLEIRASSGPSRIVAEQYGISGRQVRDIRTLKVWKHLS